MQIRSWRTQGGVKPPHSKVPSAQSFSRQGDSVDWGCRKSEFLQARVAREAEVTAPGRKKFAESISPLKSQRIIALCLMFFLGGNVFASLLFYFFTVRIFRLTSP